jgi:alpha-ketoglutarate-dependent taurine dioxygenase
MTEQSVRGPKQFAARRVTLADADLVRVRPPDGATLPTLVEPAVAAVDLVGWAAANAGRLRAELDRSGALFLRGAGIGSAEEFERFAGVFVQDLVRDNGEHPRAAVTGGVYTPVFFAPEEKLLWHNENSFNARGPARILFCCLQPATTGGRTPVVDSRAVYAALDPALREEFVRKGVRYVRTYGTGLGLDWPEVFRTTDRAEVEARCAADGMSFSWRNGRLRTRCVRAAAVRHPRTGEPSWFNQAQHWHPSCLDREVRASLLASLGTAELPRTCTFGDGSPIPDDAMAAVLATYERLEVSVPWAAGDVMVLDNVLTAHARDPFTGPRRLLVAMGDVIDFRAEPAGTAR